MRILMLLSRIPYPLEKGDKLRAFHQIKHLSENHEIILLALNDRKVNKQDAFQFLQAYCRSVTFMDLPLRLRVYNIIKAFIQGKPLQIGYFYNKKAKKEVLNLIHEYKPNYLFCQLARMAEYGRKLNIPKALDYQDAFSKGIERRIPFEPLLKKAFLKIEYKRMIKYEASIFDSFDKKFIISEADRNEINHPHNKDIQIISNGVDAEYFKSQSLKKKFDILFTGNMNYPPNIKAIQFLTDKIVPELKRRNINPQIVIAGASPSKKIKSLSSSTIKVTEWVEDIRPYYDQAKIFVAPMLIGTGLQNKILEAMSMEIPCITSELVNKAIQARPKEEILIAQTAEQYADLIEYLLKNIDIVGEIGKKGRIFVQKNFSWEKCGEKLDKTLFKH